MKPINVGLLGIGTVGGGTFTVLKRNEEEITRRAGRPIRITTVADKNLVLAREVAGDDVKLTDDAFSVVTDPEIDIVIELIGGYGMARELVLKAIENGKHVVTANKALLAVHGNEIFAAAQEKGVMVAFEAAVAGGIPIIKALREGLSANRIQWLAGIINGTTNFILSEMRDRGLPFAEVLKEAQALGYAEADPTFDIEGVDAAHKATIMSAIAFGIPMQFDKAHIEGITKLESIDITYAEQLGYRIKLLGIAKKRDDGVELRVHPTLIPEKRLIANVEGPMNAVLVQGDAVGATLYYGKGAGAEPTASAVIADLVDVTRLHTADPEHRVPHLAFQPDQVQDLSVLPIEEIITSYYLRMRVEDQPGVLADITRILADSDISIDAMIQKEPAEGESQTDIIMLTHQTVGHAVRGATRMRHVEKHHTQRIGWLRAAVLGANDGIVSTSSLILGVAAAEATSSSILIAGVAGMVAGAMSMAAGEYVSVSSQSDTEQADIERERRELLADPEHELMELTSIYVGRGLDRELARQVATQLMARDALGAHARDELGISDTVTARPVQAALSSAAAFSVGAALPLLVVLLVPVSALMWSVSGSSLLFLATLGALAANAGGAPVLASVIRVGFWGALAMALTAGVGALFGVMV